MNEIRCTLEFREDQTRTGPGRLVGTLLTEGERASDRAEVFLPGSLSWPSEGVTLRRQHRRDAPIMRVIPERRGSQIVIDSLLPDTQAGRDTASEIRSGLFRGLSVEFKATVDGYRRGLREIKRAALVGAGLVDDPSYTGSAVAVRHKAGRRRRTWL